MEELTNQFHSFDINIKKNCVSCQNKYIIEYDYAHSDKLCIICFNNYNKFMHEDNEDYTEII